jgi:iron complex transport system substrate-binding protein
MANRPTARRAPLVFAATVAVALIVPACRAPQGGATSAGVAGPAAPVHPPTKPAPLVEVAVRHATGFTVETLGQARLLHVTRPWPGATTAADYVLVPRGTPLPEGTPANAHRIEVPARRIVALATPHIAMLELLDSLDALVAIETRRYVSNPRVIAAVAAGTVAEVGSGPTMDLEKVVDLKPDAVLCSSFGDPAQDSDAKLTEAGLPAVLIGDYAEQTALGRAEWVKVLGMLLGREREAVDVFDRMEADYVALAEKARAAEPKPTVFLNTDFEGTWYLPGGEAYEAKLLADAGARYLWADDPSSGALALGVEAVLEKAQDADIWLNPGTATSLAELASMDRRYTTFRAFREGHVYNHTQGVTSGGPQDFWETGACRPDLVLRDVVKVLHPDLLPEHQWKWYCQLR